MCATFGYSEFKKNENLGYERFSIVNRLEPIENSYYTYPNETAPIVISHSPNKLYLARRGFPVTIFSKGKRVIKNVINARAETVDTLESNELFAIAGLYKEFPDPTTSKPILRFVLITTTPNEIVEPVHEKAMAVILKREDEQTWLNPDLTEASQLKPLLAPYPADEMECYPVSRAVGKNTNDYPELIKPLRQDTLL
jgi:putative SOS response-associated peptidase YedK